VRRPFTAARELSPPLWFSSDIDPTGLGFSRKGFGAGVLAGVLLGSLVGTGSAQEAQPDLSNLSLETLSSTQITSISRKEQKLTEAAGAIYVISSEDIRRSGLTNIAELLRTVPGLDVAQIDANKWAITGRGFNERFADKMLVLMDGRTLYTPLTSGVNWDVQETMLEDIERIEVIRGPGATLWGSNAVNGIVNIITKKAKDTAGLLVEGSGAIQERSSVATRFGGSIGPNGHYRVSAKYFDRDGSRQPTGGEGPDGWHDVRGGFRTDWRLSPQQAVTVEGDLYRGRVGQTVPGILSLSPPLTGTFVDKTITSGGDILGRWTKSDEHLETTIQAYFDLANRDQSSLLREFRHTINLELDQRYHPGSRHDLIWASEFRYSTDRTVGSLNISFDPASRSTQLYGAFVQDEIALLPDKLKLTLGSKLEHNYYSGFALQPNVRMIWIPNQSTSTWLAISRASENSSRADADIRTNEDPKLTPNGTITLASNFGKHHLPSDNEVAYEFGSRLQIKRALSFDLATFYNHYTNRHTHEPGTPYFEDYPLPRHLVLPTYVESNIRGETHGLEILARTQPAKGWDLTGSYTLFEIHLHQTKSSKDFTTAAESEGSSPRHEFQIHSSLSLPHRFELDSSLYYVGSLYGPGIQRYTRLDLQAGWRPDSAWGISIGGRNLLQSEHYEFGSGDQVQSEPIGRSAYLKVTRRF
jgi:iron complex outermembrane recepter protein